MLSYYSIAVEEYKPYLHKAQVPEHPKVKLYGSYQTNLFPGAATYTYPIEIPKGTNDLQPLISISYNSQAVKQRSSILGAGWSLSQDYIMRFVNGTPPNASNDMFKLVLMGSSFDLIYDSNDGYYHTKTETFLRIQNLSSGNNTYGTYWLVTTKDGILFRFGFSNNSELISNSGYNNALKWSLDTITNTYGNIVNYTYMEDPNPEDKGTIYLSNITYNRDGKRKINFYYESNPRPDRWRVYEQGNLLEESRRLASVNVTYDGQSVRSYKFEYTKLSEALTTLSKISYIGSKSGILHNVSFDYYAPVLGYNKYESLWLAPDIYTNAFASVEAGLRNVDLNNDGFMDFIKGRGDTSSKAAWLNNKSGNFSVANQFQPPGYIAEDHGIDLGIRFIDLNNDGLSDWLQSAYVGGTEYKATYLNNGSGWVRNTTWDIPQPVYFIENNVSTGVEFGDINGDGKVDFVQSHNNFGSTVKKVYFNNGSGWVLSNWPVPILLTYDSGDNGARLEDVNGDGLPDLIQSWNATELFKYVYLNNGSGWRDYSISWSIPVFFTTGGVADEGVRFTDVNGDSLPDIVQYKTSDIVHTVHTWLHNGSGWVQNDSWNVPESFVENTHNLGRRIADINGDGTSDIVVSMRNGTSDVYFTWIKNFSSAYLLKSIQNELGGVTTITYTNSTQFDNTGGDNISDIGFNILVVKTVLNNNSLNGSFNTLGVYSYNYRNGSYDYLDLEFRGFSQVNETLPDNNTVIHYFYQDDALKGKEYRTEIYNISNAIYSKTETGFNYSNHSSVYFKIFLTSQASYTHDGQLANPKIINVSYTYDDYGNIIDKIYFGDINISGDEKLEHYDYVYNNASYIVNKVSWYRLFATDNTTLVKDSKYSYDGAQYSQSPTRGGLTKIENWLNTSQNQIIQYEYNNFGNIVKEIDPLGRVTQYIYGFRDTTYTYVDRVLNPLSHAIDYEYDLGTGNILKTTKNNIQYNNYYDEFGRITKEVQPYDSFDLPTKSYIYSFDGTAPDSILVKQKTTSNKSLNTIFFFDGFANLVQVKRSSYDNNQIVKNLYYDGMNRVSSEQNPYFEVGNSNFSTATNSANKTFYTYDPLNRVTKVTGPDGTSIVIDFNHWIVTAYDQNNHRKQYLLDAYDRIKNVVEYNWDDIVRKDEVYNTSYAYDTTDNLVYINDSLGNEFRFRYDSLGRKIQLDDPDIGTYYYKYDLAGNLVQQTGGGGNLITGDGYYREYNELNQLIRIRNGSNSSGNILEEYTYDPYGDRIKIKRYDTANTTVYTPYREWTQIRNSSGTYDFTYIYDGSTLVARINPDGSKHYFHDDHLGSVSLITNQSGAIIEQTFFEPYGLVEEGGSAEDKLYTGQFFDKLTAQMYFGARDYKPYTGQFIQCDKIKPNAYNPQSLNCYSYGLNNPYRYKDDSGQVPVPVITGSIGGIVGFFIGAGYSAYSQYKDTGVVDIQKIGQASLVGASAGFVAGATFGLATPSIVATEAVGGAITAAPLVATAGGISNVAGGQTAVLVENALSGADLLEGLGDPQQIGGDFLFGTGTAGLTYGAQVRGYSIQTNKGTFERSSHAAFRMQERAITSSNVGNTINNYQGFLSNYKGDYRYNYYDPRSRVFVPTKDNRIKTVYKEKPSKVEKMKTSINKNQYR